MVSLKDSVYIQSTPERLFRWLEVMPDEYCRWHPDHVSCRVLKGSMLVVGTEMECREHLHGKPHTMRLRLTRIDPRRRMEYEIVGMGQGAFEAVPERDGFIFTAELALGTDVPIVSALVDAMLPILFAGRLTAMRRHMAEEGVNLKRTLESGW